MTSVSNVLVTGGAGYIGSVLVPLLLEAGYSVTVLDRFFFGPTLAPHPRLTLWRADVRDFDPDLLRGFQAVIDMAALSNDPAGELDPENTLAINFQGRARVAREAKAHGVERYVLASSCSIYGFREGTVDESTPASPLTTYALANQKAEEAALALAGPDFVVTVLRQATVYGLSPRMRFDLAINGMVLGQWQNHQIPVLRDGNQWRPMVHVRDTSRAFMRVLGSPPEDVNGEIFNVGGDEQNFQILSLAERVAQALGEEFVPAWYGEPDHRSYRVSFAKIKERLDFRPALTPEDAAHEIAEALTSGLVTPDTRTRTVEWYKQLIYWHQILREVELDGRLI